MHTVCALGKGLCRAWYTIGQKRSVDSSQIPYAACSTISLTTLPSLTTDRSCSGSGHSR